MEKSFTGAKYSFDIDESKKVLCCYAEGLFTMDVASSYNSDFNSAAKKCAKKGYSLIVDVTQLKPVGQEQIDSTMQQCIANYLSDEFQFRNVFVLKPKSFMAQAEVNKIPNIKGVTWVNSKEEAYKLL